MKTKSKLRKIFKVPDVYVLLFGLIVFTVALTYFIPAGEFERETSGDQTLVVPGSFSYIDQNPAGLFDVFLSIQLGMIDTAGLIFLVLFTGGAFAVIEASGAIDAGISTLVSKLKNYKYVLVIAMFVLFSLGGATGIITNAVIAFIPLGIVLAKSLKLDAVAAVAIIYLGAFTGFNVAFLNPKTLGVAQTIAELPMFSGMTYRFIIYLIMVAVTVVYVCWYIKKISQDPSKSLMADNPFPISNDTSESTNNSVFTIRHKFILLAFAAGLIFYILGVSTYGWGVNEMAAMFIIITVVAGIIARMNGEEIVKNFMIGAQKLVYGALIMGVARAIYIILEQGIILDTVVYALTVVLEPLSPVAGAIGMLLSNLIFNFFVSSGSGQAVVVMPILTPLADSLGISRQIAVQAYQFGDGITNNLFPTSGVLMASIAAAGVPYVKWLKFIWPVIIIWIVIASVALTIGVLIGWN